MGAVVLGTAAIVWAAFRWLPTGVGRLRRWRATRRDNERARFKRLLRACRDNDPASIYNAYVNWVSGDDSPASAMAGERTLRGNCSVCRPRWSGTHLTGVPMTWCARCNVRGRRPGAAAARAKRGPCRPLIHYHPCAVHLHLAFVTARAASTGKLLCCETSYIAGSIICATEVYCRCC